MKKTKKTTVPGILRMKAEGRRIAALTAYSASMARLLDDAGIPLLIVGDSVGMVEHGTDSTLGVTMDEMILHTRAVAAGRTNALVVSDMPFGSYQVSLPGARANAARLIKEGRAEAVKLEGGTRVEETIRAIVDMDVPVMGHIGLTPQSLHALGGYRVQGRDDTRAEELMEDARAVERAGAFAVVLECIPAPLAGKITRALSIPTIGIGAGPHCDGQVLVVNDMLGLDPDSDAPRFVKRYAELGRSIRSAVEEYMAEVADGRFPAKGQSY